MATIWIGTLQKLDKEGHNKPTKQWMAESSPAKLKEALVNSPSFHGTVVCEKHNLGKRGKALLISAFNRRDFSENVAERMVLQVDVDGARAVRGSHEKFEKLQAPAAKRGKKAAPKAAKSAKPGKKPAKKGSK